MNNTKTVVMTVVVVLTVIILVLALRPSPATNTKRFEMLENRLGKLEQQIAKLDTEPSDTDPVTGMKKILIQKEDDNLEENDIDDEVMVRLQSVEDTIAQADISLSETIAERVEEVVDEKVDELEKKQNKKPSLEVFADVLELTDNQRSTVDEQVWLGQKEVRTILETPTTDGSILIDELVDVLAAGEAKHPDAGPGFMKWLGRVISEKIPGTETTYAAEIETVKNNVRDVFRSEFTEEQYAKFESWGVDPTEIKELNDNPWADFEERVKNRIIELAK